MRPSNTPARPTRRDGLEGSARRRWESGYMTIVGFILVAFGVLALVYGGISIGYGGAPLDVVPSRPAVMEFKTLRHSPFIGGIALIAGLLLLVVPRNLPIPSTARARRGEHLNDKAAPDANNVSVSQRTLGLPAAPTRVTGTDERNF